MRLLRCAFFLWMLISVLMSPIVAQEDAFDDAETENADSTQYSVPLELSSELSFVRVGGEASDSYKEPTELSEKAPEPQEVLVEEEKPNSPPQGSHLMLVPDESIGPNSDHAVDTDTITEEVVETQITDKSEIAQEVVSVTIPVGIEHSDPIESTTEVDLKESEQHISHNTQDDREVAPIDIEPSKTSESVEEPKSDITQEVLPVETEEDPYPIQLIYPSEDHEILLVNETSLAWLSSFNKPVAIVAVCGPLHSGKSFLMNQLLGRTSGFALGPTTEPKTRGLWMWNKPLILKDHAVIFLDSEGLFASNISEAYDAKIFAISSLMSSYLIYNSVKFIDQSAIDYIELLARRAQLFGIKAEIATSNEETFVSTPKLLWVVQDFVQAMEHGETPQMWLVNLLASRKKSESTASSLPQLFDDIDCFTLFLPEYRRERLRHLDQVDDAELLPEYRADMALLRDKVVQNAKVKTRGKTEKLTGAGASALLRTLVTAANQGSFPEVPSIWKSFLKVQTQQAILDAVGFYDSMMEHQCERQGPFSTAEFALLHSQVFNDTKSLFSRLTFGFKDLEKENIEELVSKVSRLYSGFDSGNSANLTRICQNTYKATRDDFKIQVWRLEVPMQKKALQTKLSVLQDEHLSRYRSALTRYQGEESYKSFLGELKATMRGETNGMELKNAELLQEVIANYSVEAVSKCSHYFTTQDPTEQGVGAPILKKYKEEALALANKFFNEKAGYALDDLPTAPAARKALETELQSVLTRFDVLNSERIERRTQRIAIQLGKEMSRVFDEIRLPQTKNIIESRVEAIKNEFVAKFDTAVVDVVMMEPTKGARQKLIAVAANDLQELFRRNTVKYDRIISDALPTLKSSISPIISSFWWPPHAEEFARRAVNATLQGVELIENEDLVSDLADRFIDANLADEIWGIWKKTGIVAGLSLFIVVAAFVGLCCRRK